MEAKGKNYLRISGILELLIGIANLAWVSKFSWGF